MSEQIDTLLDQMTLQEKVSMLAGASMWYTVAIERLGIPALKVTDGPNGARGEGNFAAGVKSACFPAEISLASTWNTDLVERVGQALGQETKTKGAQVLLASHRQYPSLTTQWAQLRELLRRSLSLLPVSRSVYHGRPEPGRRYGGQTLCLQRF